MPLSHRLTAFFLFFISCSDVVSWYRDSAPQPNALLHLLFLRCIRLVVPLGSDPRANSFACRKLLEESCDFSSDDIHLICWSLTLESRIELCLFGPFGLSQNRHTPEVRAFRPNLTFGPKAKISAKQSSPPSPETASINSP